LTTAATSAHVISDFTARTSLDQKNVAVSDLPLWGVSNEIELVQKMPRPDGANTDQHSSSGFRYQTFECFNCNNVEKVMAETKRASPFARLSRP
jgi:hypothetical protein